MKTIVVYLPQQSQIVMLKCKGNLLLRFNNVKRENDIDDLDSQFGNLKINGKENSNKTPVNNNNSNKSNIPKNNNCPWAVDDKANYIPTSSSTYGAYYFIKNK